MIDAPANYRAIPPSQDHLSDTNDTGVDGDSIGTHSARDWISSDALARWTCYLLGCAILLPWNALVSGTPYFLSRLAYTDFYPTFSSYLSSVFTITKLLFLFYCTITSKQSSPSRRIFVSIIAAILLIVTLCLSTFFRSSPSTFFFFTLFNTACLAVTSSYLCAAAYAKAALLGQSFLQSMLSGQAAIAVVISAVQVVSAVISLWSICTVTEEIESPGDAEGIAARIFFGVSAMFLCTTLVVYAWLAKQNSRVVGAGALKQSNDAENTDELSRLIAGVGRGGIPTVGYTRAYQIFKENWIVMFSVAYVYTVTLAVYPAITVRVQSVDLVIPPLLFSAIHFLVFNIGDLVGRHTCSSPRFVAWSTSKISSLSFARTLFIPLILLCNIQRPVTTSGHPISPVINSDALFMIVLFAMGYTNGFVACLGMLAVSSLEHNPGLQGRREDVDLAAALGGTFMMVGLASGALSSFIVEGMV